jgi:phosphohistidine phosphatase SixA
LFHALISLSLLAQAIFVVRHADRSGEPDPPLNEAGIARAQALASLLRDANVSVFLVTDTVRAQQTAQPLARMRNGKLEIFPQTAIGEIVQRARAAAKGKRNVLIVGHRATVPMIVAALGAGEIAPLESGEHDRLVILTLGQGPPLTLRYGDATKVSTAPAR